MVLQLHHLLVGGHVRHMLLELLVFEELVGEEESQGLLLVLLD